MYCGTELPNIKNEKNDKTYSQDLRQSSKSEEKAQAITKRKKADEQTGANSTFKRKCIVEQNYLTLKTEKTMKKKSNLTLFMKQLIRSLKEEERFSTAHIYQSTLNAFMLFCKTDAIRFNQMERSRLKQFENHLRNKGCTWNTVSTYMRTLRSIYNKAVDDGLAEEKPRLFRHVYTGVKANTKRALDAKDMSKLLSASLPRPLPQSMKESRAWITLMFLLRGMPFVDLAHLRKTDLQDSVISYRRHKTGALLTVEIPPAAMNLIKRYQNTDSASPYLLPILSGNRKSEEEYAEYQHALRKLNYDLKQLAVYCGIKLNVSSYTSRHTWATLAKYCHFSEQLICDALGHSSTKVTETYLKSFKNDELDRANKVIINHINISI